MLAFPIPSSEKLNLMESQVKVFPAIAVRLEHLGTLPQRASAALRQFSTGPTLRGAMVTSHLLLVEPKNRFSSSSVCNPSPSLATPKRAM